MDLRQLLRLIRVHEAPIGGIRTPMVWGVSAFSSKEIIVFISKQVKEVSSTSLYVEMQLLWGISSKI